MTVTFFSNFLTHHQLPFCNAMCKRLGDCFRFVATTPTDVDRLDMGYPDMNKQYPFVLTAYDDKANEKEAMQLALNSDVIVSGSAPRVYTTERIKHNRLTFRYSERVYKKGLWRVVSPRGLYYMCKYHTRHRRKNLYMLCAGAYNAGDFALVGAYRNKTYKWGYFPEVNSYDIQELIGSKNHNMVEILWCGRFLQWKHPEKAVYVARRLKSEDYNFKMSMIGIGEKEEATKKLVDEYGLNNYIEFLGAMPPERVLDYMERANIFLFTSDYNEGWAAVLNESMGSGCAVVASHAIGAVPFLVKHGENGLVYKNNSNEDLYDKTKMLMDSKDLREKLGEKAYLTIRDIWNADNAADKLLDLFEGLLCGKEVRIESGPCSIAKLVPQWRMYKNIVEGMPV